MLYLCTLLLYSINLCLNGGSSSPVILAVQQGEQIIPVDTLAPDHTGCVRFEGEKALEPGQYMFVQNNRRLFNFLISDTNRTDISFTATINDSRTREIHVTGSEENNAYIRFYQFLQDKYAMIEKMTDMAEVVRMEETIREYTQFLAERYEGSMLSIIARNIFTPPHSADWDLLHYFDYIDFEDPRFLNTAILPLRLNEFFSRMTVPVPDSLIRYVDRFFERPMHPKVMNYCARYLFTYFFTGEIMGMESVAVHLAEKYFLTGIVEYPDEETRREMENFVLFNKQCLLGMKAPELSLPDRTGEKISVLDIAAPYTLVVFFEDGCPVCSDELLKLRRFIEEYKGPEIRVYAVYAQDKEDVFLRYADFFPTGWITVWDPCFESDFHKKYNVRGTPRFFLLDRQKRIIGRDLGTETLKTLIDQRNKTGLPKRPAAPQLSLQTENGASFSLYDVDAFHTILYFYDPACAVCGLVTKQLYDLYISSGNKDIEVYAVYTGSDYNAWRIWLAEGGYTEWVNVWDAGGSGDVFRLYNVQDPPLIMLLDKDKGILTERLSVEELSYIIKTLMPDEPLF